MDPQDCGDKRNPFQDYWEQELQREGVNPTYLHFLLKSLKAMEATIEATVVPFSIVPRSAYQEWCLQADPKKFHKFKGKVYDKNGVRTKVICKNWVFFEQATSKLILPNGFLSGLPFAPSSKLVAAVHAIQSRTDLTEEQKEKQCNEAFDKEIDANSTGNHYRNHVIRASNPYGHV